MDVDIIPSDHLYFYILPESVNRAEIFAEDEAGTEISYKKPLITFSARNLGAFIDGNYKRAVVDGESCNGEKQGEYLLVVCDRAGMVMVPFLKDYYDGIYVVNIKDIVWMQNTNQFGELGYYRALEEFAESGQSNE